VFWTLLDTYAISYPRESRIPAMINRDALTQGALHEGTPNAIQIEQPTIFQNTGDRIDILSQITNASPQWWATFSYQFKLGDVTTTLRDSFVLPGSSRFLTEFGWKGIGNGTPELLLSNIQWHRVDPGVVERDFQSFMDKRLQLQFDPIDFENNLTIGTQTIGRTTFTLKNGSGYGFWSVDLTVVLYRGDVPVGVTTLDAGEVKPGEVRPMTINWFENVGDVTRTEIQANVNVLDPRVYLSTDRF
jgi:hypothetical protein